MLFGDFRKLGLPAGNCNGFGIDLPLRCNGLWHSEDRFTNLENLGLSSNRGTIGGRSSGFLDNFNRFFIVVGKGLVSYLN